MMWSVWLVGVIAAWFVVGVLVAILSSKVYDPVDPQNLEKIKYEVIIAFGFYGFLIYLIGLLIRLAMLIFRLTNFNSLSDKFFLWLKK